MVQTHKDVVVCGMKRPADASAGADAGQEPPAWLGLGAGIFRQPHVINTTDSQDYAAPAAVALVLSRPQYWHSQTASHNKHT